MPKFKTLVGFALGLTGAYFAASYLFPEETEEYKRRLVDASNEALYQLEEYRELAMRKGQELSDVAYLASQDAQSSFAQAGEELKTSLFSVKNKLFESIETTQESLANKSEDTEFKDVLGQAVNELKEEIAHSFEEIVNSFSQLKHNIEDTTETAVELTKEVTEQ